MAFEAPPNASVEMVAALSIKGSVHVTKAVILHALARGQITQEEAKERLEDMFENHDHLLKSAEKKIPEFQG
jgi:polyhydroxyalkanoate synthesis regulator phasin